jgi:hypothetical protein
LGTALKSAFDVAFKAFKVAIASLLLVLFVIVIGRTLLVHPPMLRRTTRLSPMFSPPLSIPIKLRIQRRCWLLFCNKAVGKRLLPLRIRSRCCRMLDVAVICAFFFSQRFGHETCR